MNLAALMLGALLSHSEAARELIFRPAMRETQRATGVPLRVLRVVGSRESGFRWWKLGDHGAAVGAWQEHADMLPGRPLWVWERVDVARSTHLAGRRLALGHRRCPGAWAGAAANFNGQLNCGRDVYHLAEVVHG